jgi:hypothetical protein
MPATCGSSQCGLIEIPQNQMRLWWEHQESKLNLRVFDTFDGFRPGLGHFNTSAKTPDGRLWFANGSVLQVIDPAHLSQNSVPPPVKIQALVADHKEYPIESGIKLPALTRDLEIDFARGPVRLQGSPHEIFSPISVSIASCFRPRL